MSRSAARAAMPTVPSMPFEPSVSLVTAVSVSSSGSRLPRGLAISPVRTFVWLVSVKVSPLSGPLTLTSAAAGAEASRAAANILAMPLTPFPRPLVSLHLALVDADDLVEHVERLLARALEGVAADDRAVGAAVAAEQKLPATINRKRVLES